MGFYFAVEPLAFLPGCLILPRLLETIPRKLILCIDYFLISISLMLIGPSEILGIPGTNSLIIVLGLFLLGIANVACYSSVPAEVAEEV